MYSEEQKKRYISETMEIVIFSNKFLDNIFSNTEIFEEQLDKDVSNWTTPEIISWYKWMAKSSLDSLMTINSCLRNYTQWCLQNNLVKDHQNHFLEIGIEILNKCVNKNLLKQTILSRKELLNGVRKLVNPFDKYVILALFEGIRGKESCEIVNLNISNIQGNQVKLCTGRTVYISDELKEIIYNSASTYIYYPQNGKSQKYKNLEGSDLLPYKFAKNQKSMDSVCLHQTVYTRIRRILEYLDMNEAITPNSLVAAGQIDFMKRLANEKDMTINQLVDTCAVETENIMKNQFDGFTMYKFKLRYMESGFLDL